MSDADQALGASFGSVDRQCATVETVAQSGGSDGLEFQSGLPDLDRPPLVEVAIGIMFEPVVIDFLVLAGLHELWRSEYPTVEEHPAISSQASAPGLVVEVGIPHRRAWFVGKSGRLIQVQRDRIVVNWRKAASDSGYPRYGALRVELESRLRELSDLVKSYSGSAIRSNAVEVTYVNQVPFSEQVTSLSDIVSLLSVPPADLGIPEESSLNVRFDVSRQVGVETANLLLNAQRSPFVDPPLAVVQLSCICSLADDKDAFDVLDNARFQTVSSFLRATTATMHDEWGIRR